MNMTQLRKRALEMGSALRILAFVGAGASAAMIVAAPAMAQDVTASSINGSVVDGSGNPVSGAEVTVTSNDRGFSRTTTTSANGSFTMVQLPIGSYSVTIEAGGFATTRSDSVDINLGGNSYTFAVAASDTGGEIVVSGVAIRSVDFSGTATGRVFDVQQVADSVPVARNIDALQLLTPQAVQGDTVGNGDTGISIGGSSIAENIFYINGMNITNFRTFVGGTTVPFEFYDEVQIKTGGYQAEFGRNTGGAVIALTRSGSNTFHGGFSAYYSPDSLRADSPNTATQNNKLDERSVIDGNVWASGPVIKDRLFFFGFFNPRYSFQSDTSITGVKTERTVKDPFYGGKLDLNLFDGHRLEGTYFNDRQDEQVDQDGSPTTNFSGGENMIVKYTGSFTDFLTVSALYGKSKFNQTSAGSEDGTPYVLDGRVPASGLVYIAGNPEGLIETGKDQRENFRVDVDLNFELMGSHKLRAGWDFEKLTAENVSQYSGGIYYRYYRSGATGALGGLVPANTDYARVRRLFSGGSFDSENTAFYIQDNWDVSDRLNLSLGARNDKFVNFNGAGDPFTTLKNQWAPRLGINFDPTGEKRIRLSAFYGRYFLPVAANTNIRLAGDETFLQDWHLLPVGAGGAYGGSLIAPTLGNKVQADVLSAGGVAPATTLRSKNLKPQYMDEFVIGGEIKFASKWRAGVNLTYRKLGAVLEDFDLDGSGSYASLIDKFCATKSLAYCNATTSPSVGSSGYVLVNPGRDIVVDVADENGGLHEVTLPNSFLGVPKAERTYYAAEFTVDREFDGVWGLSGSYVWSRSRGNYEGGVKSDNGQDDTGLTQDFDELGWNDGSYGYLPNHREHTFKVYGNWQPVNRLNIGFNALLQSPRKFGCIGTYPLADGRAATNSAASWYCNAQISAGNLKGTINQPIGRANAFNSDWNKRLDLTFAYNIPVATETGGVTFRVDIFNVFNLKSKTDFTETGDLDDPAVINPNYRKVLTYQAPRSIRFGIEAKF